MFLCVTVSSVFSLEIFLVDPRTDLETPEGEKSQFQISLSIEPKCT